MLKLFSPIFLFAITWILVIVLFSLRLSNLLNQSLDAAFNFYFVSLGCFTIGYFVILLLRLKVTWEEINHNDTFSKYENRFKIFARFWFIFTIVEVIYSKGIPIIWLFTGSEKTYFDFGIPSIHGFLNALELVLGIVAFYFYKISGKKKYLLVTILFITWNIAIISRQVIIVLIIELFVIAFGLSKNKRKFIGSLLIYTLAVVIGFGIMGDLRSGAEAFHLLAQPSDNWPEWLPSGFLWVYIYVTTPINNLLYNFTFPIKELHFLFPNTVSLLLPSVIRNIIYGTEGYSLSGELVTNAFNVSSAFASPYYDVGYYGIIIFSIIIGMFSNFIWWVRGPKRFFFRAVITQIIILSIFYNHFVYLPVVFQFIWLTIFFSKYKLVKK